MAFIYHVCSTRAYLRCIVAIKTDSSLHGLTIIRRHLPRDPSMNIHPLYATGLCMLLIHRVWRTHIRIVKCPCYLIQSIIIPSHRPNMAIVPEAVTAHLTADLERFVYARY